MVGICVMQLKPTGGLRICLKEPYGALPRKCLFTRLKMYAKSRLMETRDEDRLILCPSMDGGLVRGARISMGFISGANKNAQARHRNTKTGTDPSARGMRIGATTSALQNAHSFLTATNSHAHLKQ
jgi:hypothetical protein